MKSLLSRTVLSLINGVAFAVVFVFLVVWVSSVISFFADRPVVSTNDSLTFLSDGTPIIKRNNYNPYSEMFVTLDNEEIKGEINTLKFNTIHRQKSTVRSPFEQVFWDARIRGIGVSAEDPEYWYWIHDGLPDGSAFLVGFDVASKALIGFIGGRGFTQEPTEPGDRFPFKLEHIFWPGNRLSGPSLHYSGHFPSAGYTETIDDPLFMVSDQSILAANLKDRTIETIYRSQDQPPRSLYYFNREALWESLRNRENIDKESYPIVIFDTSTSIIGLGQDFETLYEIPLPEEALEWDYVSFGQTDSREFVLSHNDHGKVEGGRQRIETVYFRLDANGEVVERNTYVWNRSYPGSLPFKEEWVFLAMLAAPGNFTSFFAFVCHVEVAQGEVITYTDATKKNLKAVFSGMSGGDNFYLFLGFFVVPVLLAWVTYRRQIKFGRSDREKKFWTGFVLLFGVPGWIGYLTAHQWPTLAVCPACNEASPVNLDSCAHCDEVWPDPERKGVEVFA